MSVGGIVPPGDVIPGSAGSSSLGFDELGSCPALIAFAILNA